MDPKLAFFIAQGISVVTGILAIAAMQLKNMKLVLTLQILINILASSNYLLLGGGAGALVSLLAVVCSVVMFFYNKKGVKPHLTVAIAFIAAYLACSVYNIIIVQNFMEIFPALAAVCFVISLVQTRTSSYRVWGALNPMFWLPYDFYTSSYVMSLVHLGILVSSLVGMLRLDRKRRKI